MHDIINVAKNIPIIIANKELWTPILSAVFIKIHITKKIVIKHKKIFQMFWKRRLQNINPTSTFKIVCKKTDVKKNILELVLFFLFIIISF